MVPVRGCAIGFGGPVELVDAVEGAFKVAFWTSLFKVCRPERYGLFGVACPRKQRYGNL